MQPRSDSKRKHRPFFSSGRLSKPHLLQLEQLEMRLLLNASLSGKGVWTIVGENPSPRFVFHITNFRTLDDDIRIALDPNDSEMLQAWVNDRVIDTQNINDVALIRIKSGRGNDNVQIDLPDVLASLPVQLLGGRGADILRGGPGNDFIKGGAGNDELFGNGGDDRLLGNKGSDFLSGQEGDDLLHGGAGFDQLDGGEGQDHFLGSKGFDRVISNQTQESLTVNPDDLPIPPQDLRDLESLNSAADLQTWFIDKAVAYWEPVLGSEFLGKWNDVFTHFIPSGFPPIFVTAPDILFFDLDTISAFADAGDMGGFSQTNIQVTDVDEADLVKTDGEYLYTILAGPPTPSDTILHAGSSVAVSLPVSSSQLTIIDALPADELEIVSQIEVEGNAFALYVHEDRVAVLSRSTQFFTGLFFPYPLEPWTQITVFDVSDRSDPQVVQETRLDGSLVTTRRIDNEIYLVTQNNITLPRPEFTSAPDSKIQTLETEAAYRQRLEESFTDFLPEFQTIVPTDQGDFEISGPLAQTPQVFVPTDSDHLNPFTDMISVVAFDLAGDGLEPIQTTSVVDLNATVYASQENLYLVSERMYSIEDSFDSVPISHIYQFGLDPDGVGLEASGTVTGRVLNQFSMDEFDGRFRIATTTGRGQDRANALFVLEQQDSELNIVGSITDLAPSEQIRSVRFMGERAFMTTFRQIDPLFAIDLSDPAVPEVAGELKIPGFSSYLHPIDENHLIGLGKDADELGRNQQLQLSLFDVSDLSNPIRVDTLKFSEDARDDRSEAEQDYHAFMYYPDYDTLALPVKTNWDEPAALQLIEVDPENGLTFIKRIEHDSDVRRSLRIDDLLYSISEGTVKVHDLEDPSDLIGTVEFQEVPPPEVVISLD